MNRGFISLTCRPLTIPSITLPPSAADAFSAGKFTTKFDENDVVDTAPKSELIEEEEKYLEAFKVSWLLPCFSFCRALEQARILHADDHEFSQ